jgi:hypothetical protein
MLVHTGLPADLLPALADAPGPPHALSWADSPARAARQVPMASGLLLGVAPVIGAAPLETLARIRRDEPWLPIVAIVPATEPTVMAALHAAGADHVVVCDGYRAPPRLGEALADEWARVPLRRLAAMVQRAGHVAPDARRLMVAGLCAPTLFSTVAALARVADRQRSSLWKVWQGSQRPIPPVGAFIDWLHLLAVVAARQAEEPWSMAIERVAARPSPVQRLARSVLGAPLARCEGPLRNDVCRAFLERMVGCTADEIRALADAAPAALAPIPPQTLVVPRVRPRRAPQSRLRSAATVDREVPLPVSSDGRTPSFISARNAEPSAPRIRPRETLPARPSPA